MATLTCDGVVGNPQESRQLFIEAWIKAGSYMTYTFGSMPPASEVTTFNSTSCSYQKMVVMTIESMEMMNGSIEFRCRTATDAGNLTSEIVNVFVDPQGIYIVRLSYTHIHTF